MKRFTVAFLFLCVAVLKADAQETPQVELDFLRGLREKGYSDLALAHLEKLKASKDAAVLAALPLESARIQLALAREKPPEQRVPFFAQARKDLEAYATANAGKPEG